MFLVQHFFAELAKKVGNQPQPAWDVLDYVLGGFLPTKLTDTTPNPIVVRAVSSFVLHVVFEKMAFERLNQIAAAILIIHEELNRDLGGYVLQKMQFIPYADNAAFGEIELHILCEEFVYFNKKAGTQVVVPLPSSWQDLNISDPKVLTNIKNVGSQN